MLLIMSDLHFVDGTAGDHNLPAKAFAKALDLPNLKKRIEQGRIKELRILFLGDIFDVVRSQQWFEGDQPDIRPWGTRANVWTPTRPEIRAKHRPILNAILQQPHVAETCRFFRELKNELPAGFPVTLRYIPGNHDRFMHSDPKAQKTVAQELDLEYDAQKGFDLIYQDKEYGVVGFHGHEVDLFNFGGIYHRRNPSTFEHDDYLEPSMGEVITIDIASRIPHMVAAEMTLSGYPKTKRQKVNQLLVNMDNIRPVKAIFPWLSQVVADTDPKLKGLLDNVIRRIFDDFAEWRYVKVWSEVMDQKFIPEDTSWLTKFGASMIDRDFHEHMRSIDNLSDAEGMLARGVASTKTALDRFLEIKGHLFYQKVLYPALRDMADRPARYLVYGHTHVPEVLPVWSRPNDELTLVNCGTFRPRIFACQNKPENGFVTHRTMSFVIVYRDDEECEKKLHQRLELMEGRLWEVSN